MSSSRQNRWLVASVLGAGAMLLGVLWFQTRRQEPLVVRPHDGKPKQRSQDQEVDAEYVVIGGVRRKASDVRPAKALAPSARDTANENIDPGSTPRLDPDSNPSVKLVVDAFQNKNFPERLSPLIPPAPFDVEEFTRNPQAYLTVVEPGRVFQTAQPGPGVPVLSPLSPHRQQIKQGESVMLKVRTAPRAPVTFASFDLGAFANTLTSISVQADGTGLAEAEFFGTPGTYNDVNILAGSPQSTGQVRFVVNVQLPRRSSTASPSASGNK